jgi:hypothetical protein
VIDLQKGQIGLYIQKDSLKEQKIGNLNLVVDKTTQQRDLAIEMSKSLEKELKVQKMKTKFYKAGSILGIGVAIITTTLYLVK